MRPQRNAPPLFPLPITHLFSLVQKPYSALVLGVTIVTGCMASTDNSTPSSSSGSVAHTSTESDSKQSAGPSKSNHKAIQHLVSTYINNRVESVPYCLVYGNPKTARVVLIMWTALTCPLCSRLHQGPLLSLKKRANEKRDFALILRDYPTDPISLQGSAMVWSLGKKPVPDIMHRLYVTHDWMNPLNKALDALEILTLNSATSPAERGKIQSAKKNETLHKTVFYSRSADQEALGLTQVPWAIFLKKKEKYVSSDLRNIQQKPPSTQEKLSQNSSNIQTSRSQTENSGAEQTGSDADWTMHVLGTPNMDIDKIVSNHLTKN
ncbi:MAG: hypothetical protein FJX00_02665 [Alphaproteobacteria bacterium]|nr:hypothetical protein [Alphaproteobacteria bacterium]